MLFATSIINCKFTNISYRMVCKNGYIGAPLHRTFYGILEQRVGVRHTEATCCYVPAKAGDKGRKNYTLWLQKDGR